MAVKSSEWAMVALLLAGLLLQSCTSPVNALTFDVGGKNGWTFPPNGIATFFNDWAKQYTFHLGDTLLFRYQYHDVLEVTRADAASCSTSNPINTYNSAGNATVQLDRLGFYSFICGFPAHCVANMKIELTVLAPGQTAPPAASPSFDGSPGFADGPGALGPSVNQNGKNAGSGLRAFPALLLGAVFAGCAFLFL